MLQRRGFASYLLVLLAAFFCFGLLPEIAEAQDAPQQENVAPAKPKKKKKKKEQPSKMEQLPGDKDKVQNEKKEKDIDPLLVDFNLPEKEPVLPESYIDRAKKKYKETYEDLVELLNLIQAREALSEAGGTERELKKNEREIEKMDKKIDKLKRNIVKDVKREYKTFTSKYETLKAEKERIDKAVEAAQEAGNDNKATKLAQGFAKKSQNMENLEYSIMMLQYFLYWNPKTRKNKL